MALSHNQQANMENSDFIFCFLEMSQEHESHIKTLSTHCSPILIISLPKFVLYKENCVLVKMATKVWGTNFKIGKDGWKKLEKLKVIYTDAATNKLATIHLKIKRKKSGENESLRNDTSGNLKGQRPSNDEKDNFIELKKKFIKEPGSYKAHVGTIFGIDKGKGKGSKNYYRIDQQENHQTRHNIQFQV